MKKLLLLFVGLLSMSTYASHITGGQVYWDALGGDSYLVHMELYVDLGAMSAPPASPLFIDGVSTSLSLDSDDTLTNSCGNATGRVWSYSKVVTIPAPTSGFVELYYTSCCRATRTNIVSGTSYYFLSKLYPAGANMNSPRVDIYNLNSAAYGVKVLPILASGVDSVSVGLAPILSSSAANAAFNPGYSATSPTGNDVVLSSGVHYHTTSAGGYVVDYSIVGTDAQGVITADVTMEHSLFVQAPGTGTNSSPSADITNSNVSWTTADSVLYSTTVVPGDTVNARLQSYDSDFLPNLSPQSIEFTWASDSIPGGFSIAPVSPQSSFTATLSNNIEFNWQVPVNTPPGKYRLTGMFTDNFCSTVGQSAIVLEIEVSWAQVAQDTFVICSGGQAPLTSPISGTTYSWSPATGLSSTNTSSTTASPTTDIEYSLVVDGKLAGHYVFEVGQNVKPVVSHPIPNQIVLDNAQDYQNHVFLYYGVPFAVNTGAVSVINSGIYHVLGQDAACLTLSDSIDIQLGGSLQVIRSMNDVITQNDFDTLRTSDAYAINLNLGTGASAYGVSEVIIPGMKPIAGGSMVRLRLTDNDNVKHVAQGYFSSTEAVRFSFQTPVKMTESWAKAEILVDAGDYLVPVFETSGFPYTFGDMTISQVQGTINSSALNNHIIPLVFAGSNGVGVDEWSRNDIRLYPQPANGMLFVEGLSQKTTYSIVDMNGRVLQVGTLEPNESINTENLEAGMYILQGSQNENLFSRRFLIQ